MFYYKVDGNKIFKYEVSYDLEIIKKLQKDSAISEDELKRYSDDVQKVTDKYIETIDKVSKEKEQDIMSI